MGNNQVTIGDKLKDSLHLNLQSAREGDKLTPAESQEKRLQICREILTTEESYVAALVRMHALFEVPMADFVKPAALRVIFSVAEAIAGLHQQFLDELRARLSKPLEQKGYYTLQVGDLFDKYASLMPMYSTYIDNFEKSNEALKKVQKKNAKQFAPLEEKAKKETGNLGLFDLLIMPVQRLPRYLLLLQSLQGATLRNHKDYAMLEQAVAQVGAVCNHINEAKRRAEQQSALLALAQRCRDRDSQKLCSPHRLLLKEWAVRKPAGDPAHYVLLALFNDGVALLSGRNATASLKVKHVLLFSHIFQVARVEGRTQLRLSAAAETFVVITDDASIDDAITAAWEAHSKLGGGGGAISTPPKATTPPSGGASTPPKSAASPAPSPSNGPSRRRAPTPPPGGKT